MITRMLAGIRNRRSGLTYCNVTETCCFYEITSSTQPTCITFDICKELKWLLRSFYSDWCADPWLFLGGGPGPTPRKRLENFFHVLNIFYSLQRGQMVLLQRKIYFSKDTEWSIIFQGQGRVQMLISIETLYLVIFHGDPDPPYPPLHPHMWFLQPFCPLQPTCQDWDV